MADEEEPRADRNGREDDEGKNYEQELAGYLQERIKPNLNSGAIPLLARSIAHDIAQRDRPEGTPSEDSEGGEESTDFEADMREFQSELGEDWILSFSVHGDEAWLTAEKEDGSQHVEAQTAAVLSQAVGLINDGGGRSG
jgi:hypothetical protein